MVKTAYVMQSDSANRKLELKRKADEWKQKYTTPQNILSIKFATYNKEACVPFRNDFEPFINVLKKLITDPNVKEKQKAKYRDLLKQMKDMRNLINLVAVINVL